MIISQFEDWELVKTTSLCFQKIEKSLNNSLSSEIEGFITVDLQDNIAYLLCIKCEGSFKINPMEDGNIIYCTKKKVLVPHCPHCGASDMEK